MYISKIFLKNAGPIKEANINLKPLNIFIGSNNTGKTYLASVVYGLNQSITEMSLSKLRNELSKSLDEMWKNNKAGLPVDKFVSLLRDSHENFLRNLNRDFYGTMFGFRFDSVFRPQIEADIFPTKEIKSLLVKMEISLGIPLGTSRITVTKLKNDDFLMLTYAGKKPNRRKKQYRLDFNYFVQRVKDVVVSEINKVVVLPIERVFLRIGEMYPFLFIWSIYSKESFPEEITEPESIINSCLKNFSSHFMNSTSEKRIGPKFEKEADYLEKKLLCHGEIRVDREHLSLLFKFSEKYPPLRTSAVGSGVISIAPLALFIDRLLSPGDLLIVDEPESNLYPQAQVELANLFAMLVNKGVEILITTHSPYILTQIDNLITAYKASQKACIDEILKKYDVPGESLLSPEKVGVFLFEDGRVRPAISGGVIDESCFGAVSTTVENLYNELQGILNES